MWSWCIAVWIFLSSPAFAMDWPSGFRTEEGTISPDGRLGFLSADPAVFSGESACSKAARSMYLADLKKHRIISSIDVPEFSEARYLEVSWDKESSACVLVHRARHSLLGIELVELTRHGARRTDLGGVVGTTLEQSYFCCEVGCHFRFVAGDRLIVRCLGDDNPRELQDKKRTFGLFTGIFDRRKGIWSSSKARELTGDQHQALVEAFDGWKPPGGSKEDLQCALEERMRIVTNGLGTFLSPEKYRDFLNDQNTWQAAVAGGDAARKSAALTERLARAESLLWEP